MGQKQDKLRRELANAEILHRQSDAEHCKIVIAINEELAKFGSQIEFDRQEIRVTERGIYETPEANRELSRIVTNLGFPSILSQRVSHYTSFDTFRAITESRMLRLYAVRKRISEDELQTLLKGLGLRGTETDPGSSRPIYEELSDHLFYTSFTDDPSSAYMWETFANNGAGVRLDFLITSKASDFRQITYSLATSP